MLEVQIVTRPEEVPVTLQELIEPNDWLYKLTSIAVLLHNGEVVSYVTDNIEPEDATFYRDLSFVKEWVELAYKFGQEDKRLEEAQHE